MVQHAGDEPIEAVLPETRNGACWRKCLDTACEDGDAGGGAFAGGAGVSIEARSVAVFEERAGASPHGLRTGRDGVASAVLDRLARAAGIGSNWHDIYGKEYTVPDATKQTLLADMGFAAGSNAQARENLGRLADWQDRRLLPAAQSAHEGEPIRLRIALEGGRVPAALILEREDGALEPIRLAPGSLEFGTVTALDGRRVDTVLAKLPAQAAGRYRIFAERAPELACHLTVAPRQCFLPELPPHSPRLSGVAAQLYALRRPGDQGVGDFTTLGQLAEIAATAGAATVGLNPLHALFFQDRERASPYYPSDRRFLDPLYIDVATLEGPRAKAALEKDWCGWRRSPRCPASIIQACGR